MYKTKHKILFTLYEIYNFFCEFLLEIGWESVYTFSSISKVFKTYGETTKDYPIFFHLYCQSEQNILFDVYGNFNTSNNTLENKLNYYTALNRAFLNYGSVENETLVFVAGNKDYFFMTYSNYRNGAAQYYGNGGVGFIPNIVYSLKKTCVNPLTLGQNVQIQLDDVVGINRNGFYQLYDRLRKVGSTVAKVTNVDSINKIVTVENLNLSFPNGVYLGTNIYNIFIYRDNNGSFFDVYSLLKVGTTIDSNTFQANDILWGFNTSDVPSETIKDFTNGKYFLNTPIFKKYLSIYPVGYFGSEIKSWRGSVGRSLNKTFLAYNENGTPVKTGSSYPTSFDKEGTYVEDIRKNWVVDSLVGKFVGFISGTGAWQSRKILSNTSNRIYFVNSLLEQIDRTSQYIIVDKVYRPLDRTTSNGYVALDTF